MPTIPRIQHQRTYGQKVENMTDSRYSEGWQHGDTETWAVKHKTAVPGVGTTVLSGDLYTG